MLRVLLVLAIAGSLIGIAQGVAAFVHNAPARPHHVGGHGPRAAQGG